MVDSSQFMSEIVERIFPGLAEMRKVRRVAIDATIGKPVIVTLEIIADSAEHGMATEQFQLMPIRE